MLHRRRCDPQVSARGDRKARSKDARVPLPEAAAGAFPSTRKPISSLLPFERNKNAPAPLLIPVSLCHLAEALAAVLPVPSCSAILVQPRRPCSSTSSRSRFSSSGVQGFAAGALPGGDRGELARRQRGGGTYQCRKEGVLRGRCVSARSGPVRRWERTVVLRLALPIAPNRTLVQLVRGIHERRIEHRPERSAAESRDAAGGRSLEGDCGGGGSGGVLLRSDENLRVGGRFALLRLLGRGRNACAKSSVTGAQTSGIDQEGRTSDPLLNVLNPPRPAASRTPLGVHPLSNGCPRSAGVVHLELAQLLVLVGRPAGVGGVRVRFRFRCGRSGRSALRFVQEDRRAKDA